MSNIATALAVIGLGSLEGFWFYRCGLLVPAAIVQQMQFRSFIVLKVFLTAVSTSMLTQCFHATFDPKGFNKTRKYSLTAPGYLRAVGGCALLGVGMAMAGSGPTLIPGQLVTLSNGYLVAAGAFAGGLLYGLVERVAFTKDLTCKLDNHSLDAMLKLPYAAVALPMGFLMLAGAVATEVAFPHTKDPVGRMMRFNDNPWFNPIVAGAVVGLNQLPLRWLVGHGQGGSTSVMSILSTLTGGAIAPKQKIDSISKAGQSLYVWAGTLAGALAAGTMVNAAIYADSGTALNNVSVFVGSALMLFGGRLANGCTCGHGITGVSELGLQSMAAAAAIFAGGIAFATVFRS